MGTFFFLHLLFTEGFFIAELLAVLFKNESDFSCEKLYNGSTDLMANREDLGYMRALDVSVFALSKDEKQRRNFS